MNSSPSDPGVGRGRDWIDDPAALEALAGRLRARPWFALDTEFLRERTYYPRLCLVQVATPDEVACIDPLALPDLGPLLDCLYDPAVVKVLHAARQDLEIFFQLGGRVPAPVFDTQVAAGLLGETDQVGYGALVESRLGVKLAKGHARTDWCQRPLDPEQLRYAADDVRYLAQLYPGLRAELEARGRLEWLEEEFRVLADPATYTPQPEEAWKRVKEVRRLRGQDLAVLAALAAWRERKAMAEDRPRRRILRDEALVDLARGRPSSLERLARVRGVESRDVARYGKELLAVIATAAALPRDRWPAPEPRPVAVPEQDALVDALMAVLRLAAREADISPARLATRKDLERMAAAGTSQGIVGGWRRAVIGPWVDPFLQGRRRLEVADGRLRLSGPEGPAPR